MYFGHRNLIRTKVWEKRNISTVSKKKRQSNVMVVGGSQQIRRHESQTFRILFHLPSHHESLTGWSKGTGRVGSGSKSKDDGGNEFHGVGWWYGLDILIFVFMDTRSTRDVEVFRSQYWDNKRKWAVRLVHAAVSRHPSKRYNLFTYNILLWRGDSDQEF